MGKKPDYYQKSKAAKDVESSSYSSNTTSSDISYVSEQSYYSYDFPSQGSYSNENYKYLNYCTGRHNTKYGKPDKKYSDPSQTSSSENSYTSRSCYQDSEHEPKSHYDKSQKQHKYQGKSYDTIGTFQSTDDTSYTFTPNNKITEKQSKAHRDKISSHDKSPSHGKSHSHRSEEGPSHSNSRGKSPNRFLDYFKRSKHDNEYDTSSVKDTSKHGHKKSKLKSEKTTKKYDSDFMSLNSKRSEDFSRASSPSTYNTKSTSKHKTSARSKSPSPQDKNPRKHRSYPESSEAKFRTQKKKVGNAKKKKKNELQVFAYQGPTEATGAFQNTRSVASMDYGAEINTEFPILAFKDVPTNGTNASDLVYLPVLIMGKTNDVPSSRVLPHDMLVQQFKSGDPKIRTDYQVLAANVEGNSNIFQRGELPFNAEVKRDYNVFAADVQGATNIFQQNAGYKKDDLELHKDHIPQRDMANSKVKEQPKASNILNATSLLGSIFGNIPPKVGGSHIGSTEHEKVSGSMTLQKGALGTKETAVMEFSVSKLSTSINLNQPSVEIRTHNFSNNELNRHYVNKPSDYPVSKDYIKINENRYMSQFSSNKPLLKTTSIIVREPRPRSHITTTGHYQYDENIEETKETKRPFAPLQIERTFIIQRQESGGNILPLQGVSINADQGETYDPIEREKLISVQQDISKGIAESLQMERIIAEQRRLFLATDILEAHKEANLARQGTISGGTILPLENEKSILQREDSKITSAVLQKQKSTEQWVESMGNTATSLQKEASLARQSIASRGAIPLLLREESAKTITHLQRELSQENKASKGGIPPVQNEALNVTGLQREGSAAIYKSVSKTSLFPLKMDVSLTEQNRVSRGGIPPLEKEGIILGSSQASKGTITPLIGGGGVALEDNVPSVTLETTQPLQVEEDGKLMQIADVSIPEQMHTVSEANVLNRQALGSGSIAVMKPIVTTQQSKETSPSQAGESRVIDEHEDQFRRNPVKTDSTIVPLRPSKGRQSTVTANKPQSKRENIAFIKPKLPSNRLKLDLIDQQQMREKTNIKEYRGAHPSFVASIKPTSEIHKKSSVLSKKLDVYPPEEENAEQIITQSEVGNAQQIKQMDNMTRIYDSQSTKTPRNTKRSQELGAHRGKSILKSQESCYKQERLKRPTQSRLTSTSIVPSIFRGKTSRDNFMKKAGSNKLKVFPPMMREGNSNIHPIGTYYHGKSTLKEIENIEGRQGCPEGDYQNMSTDQYEENDSSTGVSSKKSLRSSRDKEEYLERHIGIENISRGPFKSFISVKPNKKKRSMNCDGSIQSKTKSGRVSCETLKSNKSMKAVTPDQPRKSFQKKGLMRSKSDPVIRDHGYHKDCDCLQHLAVIPECGHFFLGPSIHDMVMQFLRAISLTVK